MLEQIIACISVVFLSINIFNLSYFSKHLVISPTGVNELEDFPGYFLMLELIVFLWRLAFSIVVIVSMYNKILNASVGFLIIGMASYTDNTLNHMIHELGPAATTLRVIILLLKFVLVCIGIYVIYKDFGKFSFKVKTNKEGALLGILDCSVFLIGISYNINSLLTTYPWEEFITDENTREFIESAVVEFYLHQFVEILLSSIGFIVTYLVNFCPQKKDSFITSFSFRNVVIGVYTSASASYYAYLHTVAEGKESIGAYSYVPINYFIIVFLLILVIKNIWKNDIQHLPQYISKK